MIGCGTQYLNERGFIRANSANGIVQFHSVELWKWRHHGDNQVLKTTAQLTLQV
jgi:hypothetical protein